MLGRNTAYYGTSLKIYGVTHAATLHTHYATLMGTFNDPYCTYIRMYVCSFMEKVKGTKYHWYPDLLEAAQVPLYDGIMPTLKLLNARRVKRLQKAREEESKRKRRQWKHQHRRVEQDRRKEWGKKQKVQHRYEEEAEESGEDSDS